MPIRWGVLGTAGIATKVGRAVKRAENAELLGIASRSKERADTWGREHGAERAYGGYDELLADPDIDAVYIPLPPSMHAEWIVKAAQHGKHVLSEKPLTMDVEQAAAAVRACSENNVQLMDGVMWVHHLWPIEAGRLLADGLIGELRKVASAFTFNWGPTVPTENIRARAELDGGSLGDLGYYCVRAILWAFGEVPQGVFARARYANGVDIELSGMLFFSNDRFAQFDCGFTTEFRSWMELTGTGGVMSIDSFVVPESEDDFVFRTTTERTTREHRTGPCVQEVRMIERMSDLAATGETDPRPPQEALNTVRVCCAIAESARTRREVPVE